MGVLGKDLVGLGDGALHAVGAGGEHEFGAEGAEQHAAFDAHGFGHGEDELVALGGGDEGQRDAGVAAGGLDEDGFAGLDFAGFLGVLDHGHADAVLDAGEGVLAFELGDDGGGQSGGHPVQA